MTVTDHKSASEMTLAELCAELRRRNEHQPDGDNFLLDLTNRLGDERAHDRDGEWLEKLRTQFIELNEAFHDMRGDPRKTWQEDAPECAETLAQIEAEIRSTAADPAALQVQYDEALRALQNTLLVVPDSEFKRQMNAWLDDRLGLMTATSDDVRALLGASAQLSYAHAKAYPQANGDAYVLACQVDELAAEITRFRAAHELIRKQALSVAGRIFIPDGGGGLKRVHRTMEVTRTLVADEKAFALLVSIELREALLAGQNVLVQAADEPACSHPDSKQHAVTVWKCECGVLTGECNESYPTNRRR